MMLSRVISAQTARKVRTIAGASREKRWYSLSLLGLADIVLPGKQVR